MTRRSFRKELISLIFALRSNNKITASVQGSRILNDCDLALQYIKIRKEKRFLLWGLLVGRSVDSFTTFFLFKKGQTLPRRRNGFNGRIARICDLRNPLTSDPTIRSDLNIVRLMRNDLFHTSGRHFDSEEMRTFVFKSARSLLQLLLDL
jgi:hypothetical protein